MDREWSREELYEMIQQLIALNNSGKLGTGVYFQRMKQLLLDNRELAEREFPILTQSYLSQNS